MRTAQPEWWKYPIAGGELEPGELEPSDPEPEPAPEPAAASGDNDLRSQVKTLTETVSNQSKLLGQLLEEGQADRRAREATRLRGESYRPTIGDRPASATPGQITEDQRAARKRLAEIISDGIPEGERMAPSADTVATMISNAAPLIGDLVDERVDRRVKNAEARIALDTDFWQELAEDTKWGGKTARDLKRRHGQRMSRISIEVLVDPRTRHLPEKQWVTKDEYLNDPDKAVRDLKSALEKELNMAAEDAPAPRPRARAATGDHGSARVPTRRTSESQEEFDKTVSGVLEPASRRR